MDFDVIIVGGGFAGLTAAWKCANLGLSTLVIEKKSSLSEIRTATASILHIAHGLYGENVMLRRRPGETRMVFQESGFFLRYTGDYFECYDNYMLSSLSGYKIHLRGDNRPLGTIIDPDTLLSDLLREASGWGVNFLTNTTVLGGENLNDKARVKVKKGKKTFFIEAKKVLVAEGSSSKVVESLGLNKNRQYISKIPFLQYTLEGVAYPLEPGIDIFYGSPWIFMVPDATGKNRWAVYSTTSLPAKDCKRNMEYFLKKGVSSSWFKKAYPVRKLSGVMEGFTPLVEPSQGHFLIIGESTGSGETQIHGAMLCGWWAGDAVHDELSGKEGYKNFQRKWLKSFPCCEEKEHMNLFSFAQVQYFFTNEELDYLFSLVDGKMITAGPSSPYTISKDMMALFSSQPGLKKEIARKIAKFKKLTLKEIQQILP